MARVLLAPELTTDFDRIVQHLAEHEFTDIGQRIDEIIVALYEYFEALDTVFGLAIRSQREAGYL